MAIKREECERRQQAKKFSHYERAATTVGSEKGRKAQTHLQTRYLSRHFNGAEHNPHRKAHRQSDQNLLPQHKKSLWRGRLDLWQRPMVGAIISAIITLSPIFNRVGVAIFPSTGAPASSARIRVNGHRKAVSQR